MFSMKRFVTYSEVGPDGKVDMAQLMNYFQDCSCFHSDSLGVGLERMIQIGKIWVMNGWQIIVERYPVYGEELVIRTWPYDFKGPIGMRNFVIDDVEGNRIVKANSIWTLLDVHTGHPVRADEELLEAYKLEPKETMAYSGRKIKYEGDFETKETIRVVKSDLDTNHHVNNSRYAAMALEYIPEKFNVRQLRVEYKHSAFYGESLVPKLQIGDEKILVILENEEGTTCVVTEFTE